MQDCALEPKVLIFDKPFEKLPMLGCRLRLFVSDSLNGSTADPRLVNNNLNACAPSCNALSAAI